MPTPQQIKKIHAVKGALKLDDATYRDILSGYGVTTSKRLTITRADELIADLEAKAVAAGVWVPRLRSGATGAERSRSLGDDPQALKIQALWAQLHQAGKVQANNAKALSAYIKRMSGKDALKWCSSFEKGRIIEALKGWLER